MAILASLSGLFLPPCLIYIYILLVSVGASVFVLFFARVHADLVLGVLCYEKMLEVLHATWYYICHNLP